MQKVATMSIRQIAALNPNRYAARMGIAPKQKRFLADYDAASDVFLVRDTQRHETFRISNPAVALAFRDEAEKAAEAGEYWKDGAPCF